jgi:hypothetical protein
MEPIIISAIIGAGATISAAIIGRISGKRRGRKEKEREIDDAARKYVDYLDKLIQDGVREGRENALLNGRAIVSTRNDLRGSMLTISEQLNSDIDVLSLNVRDTGGRAAAYETIQVLAKKWPAKKAQVEIQLRKLLAELGILGKAPTLGE